MTAYSQHENASRLSLAHRESTLFLHWRKWYRTIYSVPLPCNCSWKHTPGSCSSLQLNSTILTYKQLQTSLHKTAQYAAKKKIKKICLLRQQHAQPFSFPSFIYNSSLLSLPLHICSHVHIISASFGIVRPLFPTFSDQLIPQLSDSFS